MEYVNYTNKPCRILVYTDIEYKNRIANIKFNSLAEAYRYMQTIFIRNKSTAPVHWKKLNSLSSFRKYFKNHKYFKGAFITDKLYKNKTFYFFSLF